MDVIRYSQFLRKYKNRGTTLAGLFLFGLEVILRITDISLYLRQHIYFFTNPEQKHTSNTQFLQLQN